VKLSSIVAVVVYWRAKPSFCPNIDFAVDLKVWTYTATIDVVALLDVGIVLSSIRSTSFSI